MMGETPATNAKAIASGTRARATVRPDKSSSLSCCGRRLKKLSILLISNGISNSWDLRDIFAGRNLQKDIETSGWICGCPEMKLK